MGDLSYLADLLAGVKVRAAGVPLPARGVVNLGAGLSASDNPTTGATDIVSSSVVPTLVTALAAFVPSAVRQTVQLDGYNSAGDGGGGVFVWNNSDTRSDDGGTIIKVTTIATGRWNRVYNGGVNVRWFGATGNGSTDDTSALTHAFLVFQAAVLSGASAFRLYVPAGRYVCTAPLAVTGITGGFIEGDGKYASVILGGGLPGQLGLLVLSGCTNVKVSGLQLSLNGSFTTLNGGIAANAVSMVVNSAANIVPGQRLFLRNLSNNAAEMISVRTVVGTTVTFVGASGGTLYAYSNGDYVVTGPLGAGTCYANGVTASHCNVWENVLFNNTQDANCGFGLATDCKGGAPTLLTVGITGGIGTSTMTVRDPTQFKDGYQYRIWDSTASGTEAVVTVAPSGVNLATGVITITGTFAVNHSIGAYVVSQSDGNNDEHVLLHCTFQDPTVAYVGLLGWNSLNHQILSCEGSGSTYAMVSARQGGSIKWIGGDATAGAVDFEFGGGQQRPQIVAHMGSEASTSSFVSHSGDGTYGLQLWATGYDKKGLPTLNTRMIDVTGTSMSLAFDSCNLTPGAGAGYSIYVHDVANGKLTFTGACQIGASIIDVAGLLVDDNGSNWTTTAGTGLPPTETLSGAAISSHRASYGQTGAANGGFVDRKPIVAVTMVNGNNDSVVVAGDADVVVTGPTGAYVLKGFAVGVKGQRMRVKFNVNQQLTIKNNSSAGVSILTGTGADAVFTATGGFLIVDFWCDGTNWNVV